jgi:hypothetical protein
MKLEQGDEAGIGVAPWAPPQRFRRDFLVDHSISLCDHTDQ